MANLRTNTSNAFETSLSAQMGPTDLDAVLVTSVGGPDVPCYLVIEPEEASRRDYILFRTKVGNTYSCGDISDRYLKGSALGSGITHPPGSVVRAVPVEQLFDDVHDRIDVKSDSTHGHASLDVSAAPFSVDGAADQSVDLQRWRKGTFTRARITQDGDLSFKLDDEVDIQTREIQFWDNTGTKKGSLFYYRGRGLYVRNIGEAVNIENDGDAASNVLNLRGAASQAGDYLRFLDNTGVVLRKVDSQGLSYMLEGGAHRLHAGLELIEAQKLTAIGAFIEIDVPINKYRKIIAEFAGRSSTNTSFSTDLALRLNTDSANVYVHSSVYSYLGNQTFYTSSAGDSGFRLGGIAGTDAIANQFSTGSAEILFAYAGDKPKYINASMISVGASVASTNFRAFRSGGYYNSLNAVNKVRLLPMTGSLAAGSELALYGLR